MVADRPAGRKFECECCFCGAKVEVTGVGDEPRAKRPRSDARPSSAPALVSSSSAGASSSALVSIPPAPTPAVIAPDEPFFLPIPEETPVQLHGVITDGLCLRCAGDRTSGLYGNADAVLRLLVGSDAVEEYDDPHWRAFPAVGAALKRRAPSWTECICVFVCRSRSAWAVGIAGRQRDRKDAGKIALAGAVVALLLLDGSPPPHGLELYPAFAAFLRKVNRLLID